jgi:serine/threonine protein kinase
MSPEALLHQEYSEKSDSFSFGVTLWEMITGLSPWEGLDNLDVAMKVARDASFRLPIPADCPPGLRALIQDCWAADPKDRPEFVAITQRLDEVLQALRAENAKERKARLLKKSRQPAAGEATVSSPSPLTAAAVAAAAAATAGALMAPAPADDVNGHTYDESLPVNGTYSAAQPDRNQAYSPGPEPSASASASVAAPPTAATTGNNKLYDTMPS